MASPATVLFRVAFRVFHRLPPALRRRLVQAVTPNYTLGAVVLLRDWTGRLLLVRQPPGHCWSLPGGLLDRGETPRAAAARELAEETGVRLAPDALCPTDPNARVDTKARQVDLVFTATVDAATTVLTVDSVEVVDAAWYPVDAFPALTVSTARLLASYRIGPYLADDLDGVDRE
ncbi:MAG TPA: NUDIX domain-containing protein [Cryptosporangiaceae bacterium]|nr:NUDIX domain-containing protein [Cryptosporangiaceae bacterium]